MLVSLACEAKVQPTPSCVAVCDSTLYKTDHNVE